MSNVIIEQINHDARSNFYIIYDCNAEHIQEKYNELCERLNRETSYKPYGYSRNELFLDEIMITSIDGKIKQRLIISSDEDWFDSLSIIEL